MDNEISRARREFDKRMEFAETLATINAARRRLADAERSNNSIRGIQTSLMEGEYGNGSDEDSSLQVGDKRKGSLCRISWQTCALTTAMCSLFNECNGVGDAARYDYPE